MKKFLRKSLKILLWILGGIIILLLLLLLLIQIPSFQNFLKDEAVSFLEDKIETPVRIDNLEIGFPKKIILTGFYFEDQNQDTLAAGERLAVNIDFYKLLSNTIEISSIELEGATVKISRNRDSVFNFDYIVEAFATEQPQDTTAAMAISIGTIDMDRVRFSWNDETIQSNILANITQLDGRVGIFDPDNLIYEFPEINVDGLNLKMTQGITADITGKVGRQGVSEETPMPDLRLRDISLKNARINYSSDEAGLDTNFDLKELVGQINELQLEQEYIDISSVEINGLRGTLTMREVQVTSQDTTISAASNNWRARINSAELNNIAFNFRDENIAPTPVGMDYGDLELTNMNLDGDNIFYSLDSVSGTINSFTMQDKSGLEIKSLQTEFLYSENAAFLKDLYLETPHTLLQDRVSLKY
ncbi:MAG TPA: AsmA family protein, partial [Gillisia sp.]|nr:AsmA family protein [Gillisia sp.]